MPVPSAARVELHEQARHVDASTGSPCRAAPSRRSPWRSAFWGLRAGPAGLLGGRRGAPPAWPARRRPWRPPRAWATGAGTSRPQQHQRHDEQITIFLSRSVRLMTHLRARRARSAARAGPRSGSAPWPRRRPSGRRRRGAAGCRGLGARTPPVVLERVDSFSSTSVDAVHLAQAHHQPGHVGLASGVQPLRWRGRRGPRAGGGRRRRWPPVAALESPATAASAVWSQLPAGRIRASSRMKRSQSKRVCATSRRTLECASA